MKNISKKVRLDDGTVERCRKDLKKLLNLNYLSLTNKTQSVGDYEFPVLFCSTDSYPDYLALYNQPGKYHIITQIPPIDIDTDDDVFGTDYDGGGLIDIRTYREKVIDYLAEHTDNETVKKIQRLEKINADDVKELENILWNELGTQEDYNKSTDIDNLAAFIRSIVGIEQEVINEKFGEFLSGNTFNSQQQEFVKQIIDYVRENGDIKAEDLIEKSPFDNADIVTLFGTNVSIITSIVATIHSSIVAA